MNQERHLLFANGRTPPPFNVGGDGVTVDIFLSHLSNDGFKVNVLGATNPIKHSVTESEITDRLIREKINFDCGGGRFRYTYNGYSVEMVPIEIILNEVRADLENNPGKTTISQLELSAEILKLAGEMGSNIIFFVHDAGKKNDYDLRRLVNRPKNGFIIFNSLFTQSKFLPLVESYPHQVIYPPIEIDKCQTKKRNPRFVTIINPVGVKGGEIFLRLAENLPKVDFLAVKGWYDPQEDGIDLRKLKNVTVWEKQDDMRIIFQVSKLLLIPSQWEEAFGRVAPEAMAGGVPVIASRIGGLVEAVGEGGISVDDYRNPQAWIEVVWRTLSSPATLKELEKKGLEHVVQFSAEKSIQQLKSILISLE